MIVGQQKFSAQAGPPSTNLVLWLEADDLGQSDGSNITGSSILTDRSGQGNNYVGAAFDSGAFPIYKTNQVNGHNAYLFNNTTGANRGSIQRQSGNWGTVFSSPLAGSAFLVLRKAGTFTDFHQVIFSSDLWNSGGSGNTTAYDFPASVGGDNNIYECMFLNSRVNFLNTFTITNWHLYEIIATSGTYNLYQNGVNVLSSSSTSFFSSNFGVGAFGDAIYGAPVYGWWGYMAAIILYNTNLGTAARQAVEQYCSTRFALGF